MRFSLLALALVTSVVIGCGSKSSNRAEQNFSTELSQSYSPPGLRIDQVAESFSLPSLLNPQQVLHSAECRVDSFDSNGRVLQSFREKVISDGVSRFSLKALESLIPVPMDWANRKRIREGFNFRYGSFAVRDAALAAQNFAILGDGVGRIIAGRSVDHYLITPLIGSGDRYEIWVDPISQLALRTERFDASGVMRFSREHESLDMAPDLLLAVWFQGIHNEQVLNTNQPLSEQVGLPVRVPTLLPAGYSMQQAYHLTEQGNAWVKLAYTNGIEPLFMLQKPKRPKGVVDINTPGKLGYLGTQRANKAYDERLHVLALDGVTGVHTTQPEGTFEVVGTVEEQELVDMLISALPTD